jgi:hypothetical protein
MADAPQQSPVGQGNYVVEAGDCLESIAYAHGYLWQTLWSLPQNAELKQQRDPHVLLPGDRVAVPPVRVGQQAAATDLVHTYVKLGASSTFNLRFLDEQQQPRSGVAYVLTIDGKNTSGTLDSNGSLSVPIPPNASQGSIQLQTDPDPETYPLNFGYLDPNGSATGVRGRLNNLGFACAATGDWDADLKGALMRYQSLRNLPPTGELDDATSQALQQDHQS